MNRTNCPIRAQLSESEKKVFCADGCDCYEACYRDFTDLHKYDDNVVNMREIWKELKEAGYLK